jgi:hypothetical protein
MLIAKDKYANQSTGLIFGDYIAPIFGVAKVCSLISAIVTFGEV